jgi:hypothetical protein
MRSNESYLRWQFGRLAREYAPNVSLLDASEPEIEAGEHLIARITASDDPPVLVTDRRLLRGGKTFLRYSDVRYCDWIDRDRQKITAELKVSRFQRIIFELNDGRIVELDGIGQAVFPLLKFFWFKLGRSWSCGGEKGFDRR